MTRDKSQKPGRYTAKFWESKVFRPTYVDRSGCKQACTAFYVRIKYGGRRRAVPLNTSDRSEAGRQAVKLYEQLRANGWDIALRELNPRSIETDSEVTIKNVIAVLSEANLRERTTFNYASALRWFAARHLGLKADKKTFGPKGSASYRQRVEAVRLT